MHESSGGSRKSVRGGDHGEKVVFKPYSRQYSPYFLVFPAQKRENKVSEGAVVAETPAGGSATA
jgi:hypothetical protein